MLGCCVWRKEELSHLPVRGRAISERAQRRSSKRLEGEGTRRIRTGENTVSGENGSAEHTGRVSRPGAAPAL